MSNNQEAVELMQAQQRIWFIEELFPHSCMYNVGGAVLFQCGIATQVLEQAIQSVISRHDALRLHLTIVNGKVLQSVTDYYPYQLDNVDFSEMVNPEAELSAWLQKQAEIPFQLYGERLFEFKILKLSEQESGYFLKFHHIIADGWSMKVITEDILTAYEKFHSGVDPDWNEAPSYLLAASEEQRYFYSERFLKSKTYWQDKLQDLADQNFVNKQSGYSARRKTIMLSPETTELIRQWTKQTGLSENVFFSTLMIIYLHKWQRQSDIILGIPVLNRSGRQERQTFGMFSSLMPLRVKLDGNMSTTDIAKQTARDLKGGFVHQKYPYNFLVRDLELIRRGNQSLFDVCVNYSNASLQQEYDGRPIRNLDFFPGYQTYGLHLLIKDWGDKDSIRMDLEYKTEDYEEADINELAVRLQQLMVTICTTPDIPINSLKWIDGEELQWLLDRGKGEVTEFRSHDAIHIWLEEHARLNPAHTALRFGEQRLTYAELNEDANRIASGLKGFGVKSGDIVGLCLERSADSVVGMFGILKAGAAYMPIDPVYPQERIRLMLMKSGAVLLLTDERLVSTVGNTHAHILPIQKAKAAGISSDNPPVVMESSSPAYVIFTSGSTGQPKGVMVDHKALINRIQWMQQKYPLTSNDVILHKTPFTFDVSVWELLWWSVAGAEVCVLPHGEEKDPLAIARVMQSSGVTVMHFVPSMLGAFLASLEAGIVPLDSLKPLKQVFASGEALPSDTVMRFYDVMRDKHLAARLTNLYGPTEAAIDVTSFDCPSGWSGTLVPIGKPISNIGIYLLNEELEPVPRRAVGELCIAGVGLAREYVGDPALTDSRFVLFPETGERIYRTGDLAKWLDDGNLLYLGRMDQQVKIRGYRIEPGEIEHHLLMHHWVREAAVVARQDERGDYYLCAYIAAERFVEEASLQVYLGLHLPPHMIPSRFQFCDSLPLTAHGKIDRKSLPEPTFRDRQPGGAEPENELHKTLLEIVRTVLSNNQIGWTDNFFQTGGDSIKAIHIVAKLHEVGITLKVKDLLDHPVICEAVRFAEHQAPSVVQVIQPGPLKPAPITAWFGSKGHRHPNHWHQSVVLKLHNSIEGSILESELTALLQTKGIFALTVGTDEQTLYYRTEGIPAFHLASIDLTGLSEVEEAAELERWADNWKADIDLQHDLLFKAALVHFANKESRLLLTAHHLIIDGISWGILINELDKRLAGEFRPSTHFSVSYGEWTEQIHALSGAALNEFTYWLQEATSMESPVHPDFDIGPDLYKYSSKVEMTLEVSDTQKLLGVANEAYRTRPLDLLLASMTEALGKSYSGDQVPIMLESHGRESIDETLDITGTVGWFTSLFPIHLPFPKQDRAEHLLSTKEILKRIPRGGIGYGVLAYLNGEIEPVDEHNLIRFNFLGDMEAGGQTECCSLTTESYGADISPDNELHCLMEINLFIFDKCLHVSVVYSRNKFKPETIEGFMQVWKVQLQQLISHCSDPNSVVLMASDFEWSGLSQKELNELFLL